MELLISPPYDCSFNFKLAFEDQLISRLPYVPYPKSTPLQHSLSTSFLYSLPNQSILEFG
ncbi:hypothetical protein Scep_001694 [Stephania cephalantha]|uniref:Uncharacterized protein n=1 Tax=Stephania cephalantha TaxID=152367 RepID=A0AAP0L9U5_9MAGN